MNYANIKAIHILKENKLIFEQFREGVNKDQLHALSKTTGLVWPRPHEPIPANMNEVMQLKFEYEPGTSFQYKPDPQIIVYLLEEIYKTEITQLFETKLLSHFRNTDYQWSREDIQDMQASIQLFCIAYCRIRICQQVIALG